MTFLRWHHLFLVILYNISSVYKISLGLESHIEDTDPSRLLSYQRAEKVSLLLYASTLMFIKLTFYNQYRRDLRNCLTTRSRFVFHCGFVLIISWAVVQLLLSTFADNPIYCIDDAHPLNEGVWLAVSICNWLSGFFICHFRFWMLDIKNMPLFSQRLALGLFIFGCFVMNIPTLRNHWFNECGDATWKDVGLDVWLETEIAVSLSCACLTTIGPLFTDKWTTDKSDRRWTEIQEKYLSTNAEDIS